MNDEPEQTAPPESPVAAEAPRLPARGFTRELTPTWLATSVLLAGQEPPDLAGPFRHVHLGCGNGETVAVVAACHPGAQVWAWDPRPEHLEATRRLRDEAGLTNLHVHEHVTLPHDLDGAAADLVVVQEVLAHTDDSTRRRVAEFVDHVLRPGGLVCVTYPSLVGWSEIVAVQALMRRVAQASHHDPLDAVPAVLELVVQLRDGGASYLTERPVVKAWLDDVLALAPDDLADRYLRDELRPMSPAQVSDLLEPLGCRYVASAQLTDDLDLGLSTALTDTVHGASSPLLRETYRDLAARRTHHVDVFRFGDARLAPDDAANRIGALRVTAVAARGTPVTDLPGSRWDALQRGTVSVAELADDPREAVDRFRRLVDAGDVHPIATDDATAAGESCATLNAAWDSRSTRVVAVPQLGSAVQP